MADAARSTAPLPVAALGRNSVGWWGMLCLIATESSLFAYLLFCYCLLRRSSFGPAWLPERHPVPALAVPNTFVLLPSSVVVWWGEKPAPRKAAGAST